MICLSWWSSTYTSRRGEETKSWFHRESCEKIYMRRREVEDIQLSSHWNLCSWGPAQAWKCIYRSVAIDSSTEEVWRWGLLHVNWAEKHAVVVLRAPEDSPDYALQGAVVGVVDLQWQCLPIYFVPFVMIESSKLLRGQDINIRDESGNLNC